MHSFLYRRVKTFFANFVNIFIPPTNEERGKIVFLFPSRNDIHLKRSSKFTLSFFWITHLFKISIKSGSQPETTKENPLPVQSFAWIGEFLKSLRVVGFNNAKARTTGGAHWWIANYWFQSCPTRFPSINQLKKKTQLHLKCSSEFTLFSSSIVWLCADMTDIT